MTGPRRRVLGLTAGATWLALDLIRSTGPAVSQLFDIGVTIAAGAAIIAFAGSALLAYAVTRVGHAVGAHRMGHGSAVLGLATLAVALRLSLPFSSGALLVALALVAVSCALALLVLSLRASVGVGGGGGAIAAAATGACAAIIEQGILHTWDAVWRNDALGWAAAVVLGATVVGGAVRARPHLADSQTRGLWVFGLWLSLLAFAFANLAFVSSQSGLHLAMAIVLGVLGLAAGAPLAARRPNGSPFTVVLIGAVAVLATGAMVGWRGIAAGAAITIASAAVTYVVSRAVGTRTTRTSPSTGGRRLIGTAAGLGISALLPFMAVQLDYDIPLGFPHLLVIVATVAIIAVVAVIHARNQSRSATMMLAATGFRTRAIVVVTAAALVAVWTSMTFNTGAPATSELPSDLRVVSWNLHYGVTPGASGGPGVDIDDLVGTLENLEADVILLQEVERGWILAGGTDLLQLLADGLGMSYVYVGAHDQQFGNAILSRYPLRDTVRISLPYGAGPQGRSAVSAIVDTADGPLRLTSLHLQHKDDEATRVLEVEALLAAIPSDLPLIIGGDFNSVPEGDAPQLMVSSGFTSAQDALLGEADTYVGSDFHARIDYLFLSEGMLFADFQVGDSPLSDHLSLAVTVSVDTGNGAGD